MIKSIPYIPPSKFYYWEKCPLKAVFYYEYKNKQFFPRHPDVDLGNIIHKFLEKKDEWEIYNEEKFSNKWNELISKLNYEYKNNDLQARFFPVQWYSTYYAVKKQLLKKQLLGNKPVSTGIHRLIKHEVLIEDREKIIFGKADLVVYDNMGTIIEIIDYKTGKIYEKKNNKLEIKETYKVQMALYAKAIIEKQQFCPNLSLININGKKYPIALTRDFIEHTFERAKYLKESINKTLEKGNIYDLAKLADKKCYTCHYKSICKAYKNNYINVPIKNNIDICGYIETIQDNNIIEISTSYGKYKILNVKKSIFSKNQYVCIYNLYYPNKLNKTNILYPQQYTVINYGYE